MLDTNELQKECHNYLETIEMQKKQIGHHENNIFFVWKIKLNQ